METGISRIFKIVFEVIGVIGAAACVLDIFCCMADREQSTAYIIILIVGAELLLLSRQMTLLIREVHLKEELWLQSVRDHANEKRLETLEFLYERGYEIHIGNGNITDITRKGK